MTDVKANELPDQVEDEEVDFGPAGSPEKFESVDASKLPSQHEDEEVDFGDNPSTDDGFEPTGPDHG